MFNRTNATVLAVVIKGWPTRVLAERNLRGDTRRTSTPEMARFGRARIAHDVPLIERRLQRRTVHGRCRCVDKTGALKFTENCGHATRPVNVFDVVLLGRRCNLANVRKSTTKRIDIGHHKVDFAFVCSSEDVQNRIGAATHSDVECHGIFKGSLISNCPRKNGFVVFLVVALCEINDRSTCLKEQPLTVGMGCQHGAVTRKRKSECFG